MSRNGGRRSNLASSGRMASSSKFAPHIGPTVRGSGSSLPVFSVHCSAAARAGGNSIGSHSLQGLLPLRMRILPFSGSRCAAGSITVTVWRCTAPWFHSTRSGLCQLQSRLGRHLPAIDSEVSILGSIKVLRKDVPVGRYSVEIFIWGAQFQDAYRTSTDSKRLVDLDVVYEYPGVLGV